LYLLYNFIKFLVSAAAAAAGISHVPPWLYQSGATEFVFSRTSRIKRLEHGDSELPSTAKAWGAEKYKSKR
jgi:hypothetical protein